MAENLLTEDSNSKPTEEFCECGTPKKEVIFIPGTDACMACHELYVMQQTGVGVALVDTETGRLFTR